MSRPDVHEAAVAALYDGVFDAAAWAKAVERMAAAFDASAATVWHYDTARHCIGELTLHGHDPAALALYASHYVTLDPARPKVLAAGVGRWLSDETLLDYRDPGHRTYAYEFARPHGLGRVGGGLVRADANGCIYLGVQRSLGAARFGERGARVFEQLAPHLARAHAMRQRVAALAAGRQLGQAVLDRLAAAVCVLDGRAGVRMVNAAAEQLFGAATAPLRLREGRLQAQPAALRDWLARALAGAVDAAPRGSSCWWAPEGPPGWTLMVVPLPAAHELREGVGDARALLLVTVPGAGVVEPAQLRELFGLTAAESDLLAALARGVGALEHARRRGVSVNTVRTHAAALLAKMGCRSQLELVALARSLPGLRGQGDASS